MTNRRQNRIIINIIAVVFIVAIAIVIALIILTSMSGKDASAKEDNNSGSSPAVENSSTEKWQEGNITYRGKVYRYNSGIKAYLFLGIDNEGLMGTVKEGEYGGQSDAMFLLVTNSREKTISIISINRNSMTDVDVYTADREYSDTREEQISLQYSYGDGAQFSCQLAADTVSRLFSDIPISGYLSLNMDGMALLNDAVGGVTVEVLENIESGNVSLRKGETVTLNGEQAYAYLRSREHTVAGADQRLERQQQYLIRLLGKLMGAGRGNVSVQNVYDAVEDYLVSNIDMVKLAEDASDYEFDDSRMYSLPGETVMGEVYAEFHVDEEELYQMVLDIFYEEVE